MNRQGRRPLKDEGVNKDERIDCGASAKSSLSSTLPPIAEAPFFGAFMPIDETKLKEYLRKALFQLCTEQPEAMYFDVVFGGQKLEMCLSVVSASVLAYSEDEVPCPTLLPS